MDNKLSIHFGEDKIKSVLFSAKNREKKVGKLDTNYEDIKSNDTQKHMWLRTLREAVTVKRTYGF